jgi:hypothetical protein
MANVGVADVECVHHPQPTGRRYTINSAAEIHASGTRRAVKISVSGLDQAILWWRPGVREPDLGEHLFVYGGGGSSGRHNNEGKAAQRNGSGTTR